MNREYSLAINAPSDLAADGHIWRDAWVKEALARALQWRGHSISYVNPDVSIWIWGWINRPILPGPKNILWVIGHPDLLQRHIEEISQISWTGIFCSSLSYCAKLSQMLQRPVSYLVCPGPRRGPFVHKPEYDLAFVGNCDAAKGRDALIPVFNRHSSNVVGNFPNASLPSIAWHGIQEVWNSAMLIPYTHHKDMSREGFVADALLDAMMNSGALALSDTNPGLDQLTIDAPQWSSVEELYSLIDYYLKNPEDRLATSTRMRVAAAAFNYDYCAERMEKCFAQ